MFLTESTQAVLLASVMWMQYLHTSEGAAVRPPTTCSDCPTRVDPLEALRQSHKRWTLTASAVHDNLTQWLTRTFGSVELEQQYMMDHGHLVCKELPLPRTDDSSAPGDYPVLYRNLYKDLVQFDDAINFAHERQGTMQRGGFDFSKVKDMLAQEVRLVEKQMCCLNISAPVNGQLNTTAFNEIEPSAIRLQEFMIVNQLSKYAAFCSRSFDELIKRLERPSVLSNIQRRNQSIWT